MGGEERGQGHLQQPLPLSYQVSWWEGRGGEGAWSPAAASSSVISGYCSSAGYSETQKNLYCFFACGYKKYAEFYVVFKAVEIIGKSAPRKSHLPKLLQVGRIKEDKLQFWTLFLPISFLSANSRIFLNSFEISVKFCVVIIVILQFCEEKDFRSY